MRMCREGRDPTSVELRCPAADESCHVSCGRELQDMSKAEVSEQGQGIVLLERIGTDLLQQLYVGQEDTHEEEDQGQQIRLQRGLILLITDDLGLDLPDGVLRNGEHVQDICRIEAGVEYADIDYGREPWEPGMLTEKEINCKL